MTTRSERTTGARWLLVLALGAAGCAVDGGDELPGAQPGEIDAGGTSLVGASRAVNATGTTLTLARPAGTRAGNVLLAAVATRGGPSITAPGGWTLVRRDASATVVVQAVYVHVAGASEPATYVWTFSSAEAASGALLAYSGIDTADPVDAEAGQVNAASTHVAAPAVVTHGPDARLVGFFGVASATSVAPAGVMTERTDDASSAGSYHVTLETADSVVPSAGSTGARVATAANAAVNIGQLVALRAASPGTGADAAAPDARLVDAAEPDAGARDAGGGGGVDASAHDAATPDAGVRGPTYYLATTGADGNPGTAASPWRTFAAALPRLRAGDTLLVRGGTYVEDTVDPSLAAGSAGAPITVRAYPGERAVHEGLVWLAAPAFWTFDGVALTWNAATDTADQHMVKFTGGTGWRLTNAEVYGAHSWANIVITGAPTGWSIDHCTIHDNYGSPTHNGVQDHNLYINMTAGTGATGRLERNLIFNAPFGEDVKCDGTGSGTGGCMGVTVDYNTLTDSSRSFLIGGQSHDSTFDHNLVVTGSVGSRYAIDNYNLTGSNVVFHDNLFFDYGTFMTVAGAGILGDVDNLKGTVDPRLDANHCPQNAAAAAYGHCAP